MDTFRAAELESQVSQLQAELLEAQQQLHLVRSEAHAPSSQEIPGVKQQENILVSIWRGFRSAFIAGVAMLRKGWQKLTNWTSIAWHAVKLAATITWGVTKVATTLVWSKTKSVAKKIWSRVKEVSAHVWEKTQPKLEVLWTKTKEISAKIWEKVVATFHFCYEKAIAVSAWLAQKMQQLIETTTIMVNRLAVFLGRMIAYGIVLVIWSGLQVASIYHTARNTVRSELGMPQREEVRAAA